MPDFIKSRMALTVAGPRAETARYDASSAKAAGKTFVRGNRLLGLDRRNDVQNAARGTRAAEQLGSGRLA